MKVSFLALAAVVVVLPAVAVAQLPAPTCAVPQSCSTGQCPRLSSAVSTVLAARGGILHRAGDMIAPPAAPVYGMWATPGVQPWQVTPASVPQPMPAAPCQTAAPMFPRLTRLFGR